MMMFRLLPIRTWLAIGGIVALVAAGIFVFKSYQDGQDAKRQVLQLEEKMEEQRRAFEREKARTFIDMDTINQELTAETARQTAQDSILNDINASIPSNDAPIAPVLRDTLNSLRGLQ